jgi:hypothetical protein
MDLLIPIASMLVTCRVPRVKGRFSLCLVQLHGVSPLNREIIMLYIYGVTVANGFFDYWFGGGYARDVEGFLSRMA